jgi:hypothetical protein
MRCDNCQGYSSLSDAYCKRCGAELRASRLPVKRESLQPTLWRQAAPVLVRGAALVAIGVAAEMALTALAKGAFRLPSLGGRAQKNLPAVRGKSELPGALSVTERVIMERRLVLRR